MIVLGSMAGHLDRERGPSTATIRAGTSWPWRGNPIEVFEEVVSMKPARHHRSLPREWRKRTMIYVARKAAPLPRRSAAATLILDDGWPTSLQSVQRPMSSADDERLK